MANTTTAMTTAEATEKIKDIVVILCEQLGWKPAMADHWDELGPSIAISPDGTWEPLHGGIISVSLMSSDNRIKAIGHLGWTLNKHRSRQHPEVPMITMDSGKTAEQVAAEITRRLLPKLKEQADAAQESYNNMGQYLAELRASANLLSEASGGRTFTSIPDNWNDDATFDVRCVENVRAKGRVYNNSVRFDVLSVPVDLAAKILKLIYEENGEER